METFALKGYLFIMIFYSTADIFSLLQARFKFFQSLFATSAFFYQSLQCQLHIPLILFEFVQHLFSHFYSKADIQESPSSSWRQNEPESQYS